MRLKNIPIFYKHYVFTVNSWSQYDNPEEGKEREGDIYQPLESRKQILKKKCSLWPNSIVHYYVPSSVGKLFPQF